MRKVIIPTLKTPLDDGELNIESLQVQVQEQTVDTPSVRQDDPWEAPAECDSARRENEGMREHFEGEERSGGVRAQASHVVSLPDRG